MIRAAWIGRIDYQQALIWQQNLVKDRAQEPASDDQLLLLEHPPTYTLGRSGKIAHLLLDEFELNERGIAFYRVGRGGDITYHGPGQLVGYPILNLKRLYAARGYTRPDLHAYVSDVEELLIRTLAHFGVKARRYDGYPGVWVDTAAGLCKMAAIGIRVSSKGISSHGFALNVNPDMDYFSHIIPCGIQGHGVISLSQALKRRITIDDVLDPLISAFREVFQVELKHETPERLHYNRSD